MSVEMFVKHGHHRGVVDTVNATIGTDNHPWPIRLCDIGEDDVIGVLYPDNATQAQPLCWWLGVKEKLAAHRARHQKQYRPRILRKGGKRSDTA